MLHLSRTVGNIIARGIVLEILEYDCFGSEVLRVTQPVNKNDSLLKAKETTLTKIGTKPFVSKKRIK